VSKGASVYRGRTGELVASPLVTLVDDGTMSREWGAIGIDDEGHPSQYNVLIENGVLTDFMWDYLRARKEGRAQTGNGRRQSYMHLPMVRMTNTYVLNGTEEPDEIVRATDHGVYIAQLGGGSVNTGRLIRAPKETPLCNLYVSMLERMGCAVPSFGDSRGPLTAL
jgi:TldD protein